MMRLIPRLLVLILLLLAPARLLAHAQGEDYVFLNFQERSITGLFEIHFEDLSEKLSIDVEADTEERSLVLIQQSAAQVHAYIRENFSFGPEDGAPYAFQFDRESMVELPQGLFAQYHFQIPVDSLPTRFSLRHSMFYEGDKLHRGLILLEYNVKTDTTYPGEYTALVFSPFNQEQTLDLLDVKTILSPRDMIIQGVLHIWIGIDHILFLLALMLPTVLTRKDGKWQPVESFTQGLINLLKIVTVFTVAHSITLLLAALDFISLPSRFVESMIALSIVLVAINNITGTIKEGAIGVILALGLFHGLGFASVMGVLPFRMVDLLKGVVGFNIGVELGQIVIVVLLFPILFFLRRSAIYVPLVLKGCSVLLALVASWWFVQRAFGLG